MPDTPIILSAFVTAMNFPAVLGPAASGMRYQSVSKIAEGGMGAVYRGHALAEGHPPVAIKLALNAFARPDELARFRREIDTVQGLSHPNIVRTLDHGEDARFGPFIVMELLEGETLEDYLDRQPYGRLSAAKTAEIALPVCSALLYAQSIQTPLVHRDIKPANIFLSRNSKGSGETAVKVMDFGIARSPEALPRGSGARLKLTEAGMAVGTLQYIAPEQCDGRPGLVSDVYSLGVMMYLMAEGRFPFPKSVKEPLELIEWHKRGFPEPMTACASHELKNLIGLMMAKKPADRPALPRVLEVLEDLAPASKSSAPTVPFPVLPLPEMETIRCREPDAAAPQEIRPADAVTIRADSPMPRDLAVPEAIEDGYESPSLSAPRLFIGVTSGEISAPDPRRPPQEGCPSDKIFVSTQLLRPVAPSRTWEWVAKILLLSFLRRILKRVTDGRS